MKQYAIKEIFLTIQGEGCNLGEPSVFVRFVGCNLWSGYKKDRERDAINNSANCPFVCDTDFTKHNSFNLNKSDFIDRISEEAGGNCSWVVFTGGEPLLQLDKELVLGLQEEGFMVAIETNGTLSIEEKLGEGVELDWIACSPKVADRDLRLEVCHEIKILYPSYSPHDYDGLLERSKDVIQAKWLQPETTPRESSWETSGELLDNLTMENCVAEIKNLSGWRMGIQAHKYWGVA